MNEFENGVLNVSEGGKVEFIGLTTITIPTERYAELIATEERLRLLKNAILNVSYNPQVEDIKDIFDIKEPVMPDMKGAETNE